MSKYTNGYYALKKNTNMLMLLRVSSEKDMYACLPEEMRCMFSTVVIIASFSVITEMGVLFEHLKSRKKFNRYGQDKCIREKSKPVLEF